MTVRQWQEVFSIVRTEQKNNMHNRDRYKELSKVLDDLYPMAYGGEHCNHTGWEQ